MAAREECVFCNNCLPLLPLACVSKRLADAYHLLSGKLSPCREDKGTSTEVGRTVERTERVTCRPLKVPEAVVVPQICTGM